MPQADEPRSPNRGLTHLLHWSFMLGTLPVPPVLFPNKRSLSPFCRWQEMKPRLCSHTQMFVTQPVLRAQGELLKWELTPTDSCLVDSQFNLCGTQLGKETPTFLMCTQNNNQGEILPTHISFSSLLIWSKPNPPFPPHRGWILNLLPHLLQECSVK